VAVYPLDFEEYMWANGIQQSTFDYLKECYDNASRVSDTVHETLSKHFYSCLVVGGMPENVFAQNLRASGL
jgi:predicted AAA+ superfamily ATPase